MRRLSTITLIIGALIAMALPASAGKGGNRPPKDSYYKGTCAAAGFPGDVITASSIFTVTLGGKKTGLPQTACVDVIPATAGKWRVNVTESDLSLPGRAPRFGDLTLIVRDSVTPGDICDFRTLEGTIGESALDGIPTATVNACDPDNPAESWGEWIHEYTGQQEPALWDANAICQEGAETNAPCLVIGPLDNVHPLAFQAVFSGSSNAAVEIEVTLP